MTFSPCCKWALIEPEGEDGVQEEEGWWGWVGGREGGCKREGGRVGWGPMGDWVEITAVKMAVQ